MNRTFEEGILHCAKKYNRYKFKASVIDAGFHRRKLMLSEISLFKRKFEECSTDGFIHESIRLELYIFVTIETERIAHHDAAAFQS